MEKRACSFCGQETIMIMLGNGFMIPIEPTDNLQEKIIPHVLKCKAKEAQDILQSLKQMQEEGEVECPECKQVKERREMTWIAPQVCWCDKCEIVFLIDQDLLNYSEPVGLTLNNYAAEINGVVISTWMNTEKVLDKTYSQALVSELRSVINRVYKHNFSVEKSSLQYLSILPEQAKHLFL